MKWSQFCFYSFLLHIYMIENFLFYRWALTSQLEGCNIQVLHRACMLPLPQVFGCILYADSWEDSVATIIVPDRESINDKYQRFWLRKRSAIIYGVLDKFRCSSRYSTCSCLFPLYIWLFRQYLLASTLNHVCFFELINWAGKPACSKVNVLERDEQGEHTLVQVSHFVAHSACTSKLWIIFLLCWDLLPSFQFLTLFLN